MVPIVNLDVTGEFRTKYQNQGYQHPGKHYQRIKVKKHGGPLMTMHDLTIMIGQLGLVYLTNRKTRRKDVNKRISRQFVNKMPTIVY